jgi:hypothetical protein
MGVLDFIVIGVGILIAIALGAGKFLKTLFYRASDGVNAAVNMPMQVQKWEQSLIVERLQKSRVDKATKELMEELGEVSKVD